MMELKLNKTMTNLVATTAAIVGSITVTAMVTTVIVSSAKKKEAVDKLDQEMREKNQRFKDIEDFRKKELDKLAKRKNEVEQEIIKLEELKRKREVELNAIKTSLADGDSEKLILSLVSGLQDSVLEMSMATIEMKKELTRLRDEMGEK